MTRLDSFSALVPQIMVEYPVTDLDMSVYDRDRAQCPRFSPINTTFRRRKATLSSSPSSYAGSDSAEDRPSTSDEEELDLNSISDRFGDETTAASLFDLFAVRERAAGSVAKTFKYRTFAKDPVTEDWSVFDGDDVCGDENPKELVTPNADMLFYRRKN